MKLFILYTSYILVFIISAEVASFYLLKKLDQNDPINIYFDNLHQSQRLILAGLKTPRYIAVSNLNYIPAPGYTSHGVVQHNEHGYSGDLISLKKTQNCLRILFLGGSTTYGMGVKYPNETYPAIVQKLLQQNLGDSIKIECINAGVEGCVSSDELNYYLHKFRHYKPDLVVINSGGNDATNNESSNDFSPDYWISRPIAQYQIDEFRGGVPKWLFRSFTFSYLYDRIVIKDNIGFLRTKDTSSFSNWYQHDQDNLVVSPFELNLSTLVSTCIYDSAKVLLVPFLINKHSEYAKQDKRYVSQVEINNIVMSKMAKQSSSVFYLPMNVSDFYPFFIDDCHLTANGEQLKANLVANKILSIYNHP